MTGENGTALSRVHYVLVMQAAEDRLGRHELAGGQTVTMNLRFGGGFPASAPGRNTVPYGLTVMPSLIRNSSEMRHHLNTDVRVVLARDDMRRIALLLRRECAGRSLAGNYGTFPETLAVDATKVVKTSTAHPWNRNANISYVLQLEGIADKTDYRSVQSSGIPAFRAGWVRRVREAGMRSWLEERRQPDAAGAWKEAKRSRSRGPN